MVRPVTKYLCRNGYRQMIGSMVAMVAADLTVIGVTAAELAPAADAFAALPLCCMTEESSFINSYCNVVYSVFIRLYKNKISIYFSKKIG